MKNKSVKVIGYHIAAVFLLITIALMSYNLMIFGNYNDFLRTELSSSVLIKSDLPNELEKIAYLVFGKERIKTNMVQLTMPSFLKKHPNDLPWKWNYLLSSMMVDYYFSDKEILLLWCKNAPYENGWGLNHAAQLHFGRNLNELNHEEIARIVVFCKKVTIYLSNPELFDKDLKKILEKIDKSES